MRDVRAIYHRPWMVHELEGPVDGLVSQNWVCKSCPPGVTKQQVFVGIGVVWQLSFGLVQTCDPPAETVVETRAAPRASLAIAAKEAIVLN